MPVELIQESENHKHDNEGVFPDNWQTYLVFDAVKTQWRTDNGWPIGLDYNALDRPFRVRNVKPEDEGDVFDGIRVMEAAALAVLREKIGEK